MRALELDYRRKNPWPPRLGWAGLVLACLALGGLGWQYRQISLVMADARAELSRLGGQARPAAAADPRADKRLETEISQARKVLSLLDVPWDELFEAVETSTGEEVALLGIEPEPDQATVRIIGEAKTYQAVLAYTRRLEESAPLRGVYLQNHQVQTQDRERPVRFVLGASWRRQP